MHLPAMLTMWMSLVLFFLVSVSAHMMEVPASKKECFFEDLHVNDKVRRIPILLRTVH